MSDKLQEGLIKCLNREAVATRSPGLQGFDGYPGNRQTWFPTSKRLRQCFLTRGLFVWRWLEAQPRWGWIEYPSFPRVAAKAWQPWALGRNRFAVKKLDQRFLQFIGH